MSNLFVEKMSQPLWDLYKLISHADIYKEHETVRLLHFVLVQSSNAVKTKIKMEKLNNL